MSFPLQALGKLYEEALSSAGKKSQLLSAVEQLVKCVQSPSCPAYMGKALLRALQEVNGEVRPACVFTTGVKATVQSSFKIRVSCIGLILDVTSGTIIATDLLRLTVAIN